MWLIPLLLVGVLVVATTGKSPRESRPSNRQLAPVAGVPVACELVPPPGPPTMPGPISVLGEILRVGQYPSPRVVLCAIAEAEAIGRPDLVSDIVSVFVAPVVYQHTQNSPPPYERGSCARRCSPRGQADQGRASCAPRDSQGLPGPPAAQPTGAPPSQETSRPATSDEILAVLHSDPNAFLAMMSSGRPPMVEVSPVAAQVPPPAPVEAPAAPPAQETVSSPGSPLPGVPDDAWRRFVACLERESPTFNSSRHIGQYRQRRDRLADLGIDPGAIQGSAGAQRAALDADLMDAYQHAAAGGLTEFLGRPILVPGQEAPAALTLSGLLGVIQCAGLEGAVGWLENLGDRKRYPNTTQVFRQTNGAF